MQSAPLSGIWTAAAVTRSQRMPIPDVGHGTLRLLGFFHDEKSGSTFKEEATGSIKQAEALGAAVAGRILAACRG